MSKVIFITGASRGMGVAFARAALSADHRVVATGRRPDAVATAVGEHDQLLTVALDVTDPVAVEVAVSAAIYRFGRIDVLINNAGTFQAGFFEEVSARQFRAQQEVNLFGPLNVTRAVLPRMRAQRSGLIVTVSSVAGLVGSEFASAYVTSKFALEGFMEALAGDVAPFGISTMTLEPGFFRTELLEPGSTLFGELSVDDYTERTTTMRPAYEAMSGTQGGDPAKLADALMSLIDSPEPPSRFVAGADALAVVEQKANTLLAQTEAYRQLSSSLAHDDAAG